jgi:hypothetical protein
MKRLTGVVLFLSMVMVFPVFAQEEAVSKQFSQTLLTIAIVLGILASIYVFVLSLRMGGGGIAGTLLLYGAGMLSVVVSLLSVTWLKAFMGAYAGIAHDMFFIIGFILMVFGSRKVSQLIS